jgi:hypothetical protein
MSLTNLLTNLFGQPKNGLSPDEKEEQEKARREALFKKRLLREQQREAKYLGKAIPAWLAKMGHAYWYKKSEKDAMKGHYNPVKIKQILIGEDAYWLQIDTRRLPRGVFIADLRDEKTLETLTAACNSQVLFEQNDLGYWYVVETEYGRGNIPNLVGYAEMLKKMTPETGPLVFPLGLGENQHPLWCDLNKNYTLQVGGAKGTGKSTLLNNMICTLITRNSPVNLRLFLTDLKGGIEFYDYGGLPHLGGDVYWKGGGDTITTVPRDYRPKPDEKLQAPVGDMIYTDPGAVLPMLKYCEAEMDRRARLIAPTRAKKIQTYNNKYPDRALSYWLIIIDELATLMEDKRYKNDAEQSLSEIARKGRAAGIYLVLATQTPTSKIVPPQISGNMDARIAFRTGSGSASGILLGDGKYDAVRLPPIEGRFIWKWGTETTQVQGPFITEGAMARIVADVKAGKYVDARQAELAQKADHLFKTALDLRQGACQTNDIYKLVKPDGFTQREVKKILEQYQVDESGNPEIRIDDTLYYLAPAIVPKRIPRWLVPVVDFAAGRHPDPNYDFNLACRLSLVVKTDPPVYPQTELPAEPGENSEIEELAPEAVGVFPPGAMALSPGDYMPPEPLAHGPNGHSANGHSKTGNAQEPADNLPAWLLEN